MAGHQHDFCHRRLFLQPAQDTETICAAKLHVAENNVPGLVARYLKSLLRRCGFNNFPLVVAQHRGHQRSNGGFIIDYEYMWIVIDHGISNDLSVVVIEQDRTPALCPRMGGPTSLSREKILVRAPCQTGIPAPRHTSKTAAVVVDPQFLLL